MEIKRINKLMELDYALAKLCFSNINIKGHSKEKILKLLSKIYETEVCDISEIDKLRVKIFEIIDNKSTDGDDVSKNSKITLLKNNLPIILATDNNFDDYLNLDDYLDNKIGNGSWVNDADCFISQLIIGKQRKQLLNTNNKYVSNYTEVPADYLRQKVNNINAGEVVVEDDDVIKRLSPRINNCIDSSYFNLLVLNYTDKNDVMKSVGPKYGTMVLNVLHYAIELIQIRKIYEQYLKDLQNPYKQSYFTPSFEDLLKAASAIYITLPDILLFKRTDNSREARNTRKLITMCKTKEYLKCYEIIYQAYQSFYNNLANDRKEKIQVEFNNNLKNKYSILSLTRFEILTPQRLVSKVNVKIMEKMRLDAEYYGSAMKSNVSVDIIKATQYMDLEMVAGIYNEIKREVAVDLQINSNSLDEIKEDRKEYMEILQYNFARALLAKRTNKKLNSTEEKKLLTDICTEYFFEEPFDVLVDESSIRKRSRIIASEKRVERRIFKIDKFNKTCDMVLSVYSDFVK